MTRPNDTGARLSSDLDRGLVPQSLPGEVEQVADPEPLDRLERDRRGVQDRGQPADRRHHVREDAEGAAERGDDASSGAAGQARGDGVDRTGAGRGDHNEGGQQKGNAHRSNLHVRVLIEDTLLAVLGMLAERDAAYRKPSV